MKTSDWDVAAETGDRVGMLPVPDITRCAFAGDDLDRLLVTSAREDCAEHPLANSLFEFAPAVKGLQTGLFAG